MHINKFCIQDSPTIGKGQQGLFVRKGNKLAVDTEIPLFGKFMRQVREGAHSETSHGRIVCVQLARLAGDPKPLYLSIDDICPGISANDPMYDDETSNITPHGYIHEFEGRDIADHTRVCIVINKAVHATDEDTEIWVSYNLTDIGNKKMHGRTTLTQKAKRTVTLASQLGARRSRRHNEPDDHTDAGTDSAVAIIQTLKHNKKSNDADDNADEDKWSDDDNDDDDATDDYEDDATDDDDV